MKNDILSIDPLKLDFEWLRQANIYFKAAEDAANARRVVDDLKNEDEVIRAGLAKLIRKRPKKFGLKTVTETAIKECITLHKGVHESNARITKAVYDLNIANALVQAMDHKKRALQAMVELHNSNYFSDPKVGAGPTVRDAVEEIEKRSVRKIGKRKK